MLWVEGLQDDLAGRVCAPRTSGNLRKQLERAFGRSEVGKRETLISERDTD